MINREYAMEEVCTNNEFSFKEALFFFAFSKARLKILIQNAAMALRATHMLYKDRMKNSTRSTVPYKT